MFKAFIRNLAGDAKGATAIEYALIVALIALGTMGAMYKLGAGTTLSLQDTANTVANATKG